MISESGRQLLKRVILGQAGSNNEKERVTWLERHLCSLPEGIRVLDAGAGECQFARFLTHVHYVSQDVCQYEGKGDSKGLHTGDWDTSRIDIVSDITAIPEFDESFDVILCTEVLEHLPAPEKAFQEFYRLLKTGGQLIITAPFCSLTHFAPYHFSSGFNRYYYRHHFEQLGFQIEEMELNGNYFEFVAQELRRVPEMVRRYNQKRASFVALFFIRMLLFFLNGYSRRDTGSDEAMCFGIHLIARKK